MTPQEFANQYRSIADRVGRGTGIDSTVLLAQWGVETGWGNQIYNQNNLGNIRCLQSVPCDRGFAQFSSWDSFVINCVETWHNGYYNPVLIAQTPLEQILEICRSPWSADHYGYPFADHLLAAYLLIGGDSDMPYILQHSPAAGGGAYLIGEMGKRPLTLTEAAAISARYPGIVFTIADAALDQIPNISSSTGSVVVDLGPVLAAIADLRAHPAVTDPAVLAIVTRMENALKTA